MQIKKIFTREFKELSGSVHNHSAYSFDCEIPLADILRHAKRQRLDYLTITDHFNKKAKSDPILQQFPELITIVGFETNDEKQNHHYLVFGCDEVIVGKPVKEYVDYYHLHGGVGFMAHPYEKRFSRKFRKYLWTSEELLAVDGLEIWNFSSSWMGKLNPSFNGILLALFPALFVRKPHQKNIAIWDAYQDSGKKIAALGGIDAHGTLYRRYGLKMRILSHRRLFSTIRTNVLLTAREEANEENILNALKQGRSYIVNYRWGQPRGFYFGIKGQKQEAVFGESIVFDENLMLSYYLPTDARVRLFCGRELIFSIYGNKGSLPVTKTGRYRLEAKKKGYGWIYTNYIYVE